MPSRDHRHRRRHHRHNMMPPPPLSSAVKQSPRLLSLFIKAVVMVFVITLFCVFVGLAAIVLLHLCLAGSALHRRGRRSVHFPSVDETDSGYSPEDLRRLPCGRFAAYTAAEAESAEECVVCLSELKDGEWYRILPECQHVFHMDCIDKWLIKVPFCPICRGRVRLSAGTIGSAIGVEESKLLWVSGG